MKWLAFIIGLMGPARLYADDHLGRLFFDESERALLDRQRLARPGQPAADLMKVDGIAWRDHVPPTVWIDGVAYHEGDLVGAYRIDQITRQGRVSLTAVTEQRSWSLRPGQALERQTGRILDVLRAPTP